MLAEKKTLMLLHLLCSACVAAVYCRPVLHRCVDLEAVNLRTSRGRRNDSVRRLRAHY